MTSTTYTPLHWSNDRFDVTVDKLDTGVYRLETRYTGGATIPTLTISHHSEALTRVIARVIAKAFKDGGDAEDARRAVVAHLDAELGFLLASNTVEACDAGSELQDAKALFETADEQVWAEKLIADINGHLDAVHGVPAAQPESEFARLRAEKARIIAEGGCVDDIDAKIEALTGCPGTTEWSDPSTRPAHDPNVGPRTLAEMARITRNTHPQVGPVKRRRRTVNGVAR